MRAIVTGMIASYPVGGVAWDYGQYALGLERLGFDVYYLEDTGCPTYNPSGRGYGDDFSYGVGFLERSLAALSPKLAERWCYRDSSGRILGPAAAELKSLVRGADLFLNVSGSALLREEYAACKCKVLIDTDPGYNHFVNYPKWDANPGWMNSLGFRGHDHFFTYAQRIGHPDCTLPGLSLPWKPTRPPVVLDCWRPSPPAAKWTTVMTWNNFAKPIEHEGTTYGTKEMEFHHIEDAPLTASILAEVAVGGSAAPVSRWRDRGWTVSDSHDVSADMDAYRDYIQGSRGELSVAKNVYVATGSGWFSCRTVCYLAAGRPAVVQDTGFRQSIPCGEGLIAFRNLSEAAAALREVEKDHARHGRAARELAASYFASGVVLGEILDAVQGA